MSGVLFYKRKSDGALVPVAGSSSDGSAVVNTVAASGPDETLPATTDMHSVTMDQDCTFIFPTPVTSGHIFVLHLSGAFTPTFPASVDWALGIAPTYTSPSLFSFVTTDGGVTWLGSLVGSDFS